MLLYTFTQLFNYWDFLNKFELTSSMMYVWGGATSLSKHRQMEEGHLHSTFTFIQFPDAFIQSDIQMRNTIKQFFSWRQ